MSKKEKIEKAAGFNKLLVVFAIALLLVGIGILINHLMFTSRHVTTNDAQVDQYVTPVASRIPGFVKEVRFEENQYVHRGDTLVIIDAGEYQTKVAMASAELRNSQQNAEVIAKNVHVTANNISVQKAKLEAAKVSVWQTEQDYNRYKSLLEADAATRQQYDHAKAAYDMALAQLHTSQEEYNAALLSTSKDKASQLPAKANIDLKKAARDNAALFLSYTVITAPYDGFVGKRSIQPGQFVKEGQTLVNVVSEEKWINANFRETQIEDLMEGTEVIIQVDAFPKMHFKGKIHSFSPASGSRFSVIPQDNATGNFVKIEQRIPIKIVFLPQQNISKLRAGMNVVVHAIHQS
ncbi:HlyD family secretion protein [Sphingobacterium sp. InxBP1]|uniref:HlyD family secretion protein n=1 Tax=Sphingobacterium sp. InxBP1 TaxID=2870328 RepID=UPI002244AFE3|nr:HlyD family secretion protein [Sphingobacterium sp. InxBP1]MCW8312403.1 HlyD family secretion protein [Sphingobacterium sp. InxBP1]